MQPVRDKLVSVLHLNRKSLGHKLIHIVGTFILVDFSWIFFRTNKVEEAFEIIKSIITVKNPWILFDGSLYKCGLDEKNFYLMLLGMEILLLADFCKSKKIAIREVISKQDIWFRWLSIVVAIIILLVFGIWGSTYDVTNFIYFQF